MRCFIAIDLPNEIKNELVRIQKQLPEAKMKLVEKQNLHLTLKFFGELSNNEINKIKEQLKNIKIRKFSVNLGKLGVFEPNFIRVVWISIEGDGIRKIQQEIDASLETIGIQKNKQFTSHLTLARIKFVKDKQMFINLLKEIKLKQLEFEINNFALKKSTLTGKGPIYKDIVRFELS